MYPPSDTGTSAQGPAALRVSTWTVLVLPSIFRKQITTTAKQQLILQPLQDWVECELTT